jgi:uncharacterized membrane protein YtjA (UPF0391 family)
MLPPGTQFSKGCFAREWSARPHASRNRSVPVTLDPRNPQRQPPGGAEIAEQAMTILKWALIFLLISIVAGVLGFTGISAASADIARFLFYVFVAIFLVLLVLGLTIFRA